MQTNRKDIYRLSFAYVSHSVESPLKYHHTQHVSQLAGSCFLGLLYLYLDVTVLTQKLCCLLSKTKAAMIVFRPPTTSLFLEMVFRKLFGNPGQIWFAVGSVIDEQEYC